MKHWIFDLDGTLVDSLTTHFQILEKVFSKYRVPFSTADHQELLTVTAKTLPAYFHRRLGEENMAEALRLFVDLTNESLVNIQPFLGIQELLLTLKKQGRGLAVWTARDLEATTKILNSTGLASYFSICVSASCTDQAKPHPEGLHRIAKHFGADSTTMIMVGDFDSDMLGAQAFGCKAIRVLWHPSVEKKNCEIAHKQFDQVHELLGWVQSEFS